MKILYLSNEVQDSLKSIDKEELQKLADKVIPFDPPFTDNELAAIIKDQKDNLFIVASKNPHSSSSNKHGYFPAELANNGMNPGTVGFVDLNHILLGAHNEESVLNRLQIHTALTYVKLEKTREYPHITTSPLHKILIIGTPPDDIFIKELTDENISISTLYNGGPLDLPENTTPLSLSGMPGDYCVSLEDENGTSQEIRFGAIAIFDQSLTLEQKAIIAKGFKLVVKSDHLHLKHSQLRLSQGIRIIRTDEPLAKVALFFISLLLLKEVNHFIEDPIIDHDKCGLCGTCVKTCMFNASYIDVSSGTPVAKIIPDRCVACGNCVTACPTQARDLPSYSYEYYSAAWQQLKLFKGDTNGLRILVIYCESNGHDALQYLAANNLPVAPSCLFLRICCGARVDTQFIPDSFKAGFDGVAVVVCSRDECGNIVGSLDLERRLNLYRKVLQASNIETGRMRILPIASHQYPTVSNSLQQFAEYLEGLKQDQKLFASSLQ